MAGCGLVGRGSAGCVASLVCRLSSVVCRLSSLVSRLSLALSFSPAYLAVAGGRYAVGVQLCSLQPASPAPKAQTNCSIAGRWTYRGGGYVYTIVQESAKTFSITSNASSDPWRQAHGEYLAPNSSGVVQPARCLGGMVTGQGGGHWDIDIHFDCAKNQPPSIISHKGRFDAGCNHLTMDDGGFYDRVGTVQDVATSSEDAGCTVAPLVPSAGSRASAASRQNVWSPSAKPGWKQMLKVYETADHSLRFDVTIFTDSTEEVVRVQSNLTALTTLTRCVGGLALLNLTLPHSGPTTLYGSTGGPAGADTALQPWQCSLSDQTALNMSCAHTAGTPFRPHEDLGTTALLATVDSGLDGRSSNFQLAIHSVAIGAEARTQHGIWMAPEYSGLWRADTWRVPGGSRFYWYLPSVLTAMQAGATIQLPAAAFGEWSAQNGTSDWSNAVRKAISQHFTPFANRATMLRPWPKATCPLRPLFSVSLSLCLSVSLFLCLSVSLSLCLSVSLSLCLSILLCVTYIFSGAGTRGWARCRLIRQKTRCTRRWPTPSSCSSSSGPGMLARACSV